MWHQCRIETHAYVNTGHAIPVPYIRYKDGFTRMFFITKRRSFLILHPSQVPAAPLSMFYKSFVVIALALTWAIPSLVAAAPVNANNGRPLG